MVQFTLDGERYAAVPEGTRILDFMLERNTEHPHTVAALGIIVLLAGERLMPMHGT